jgi:hypothetical protein
VSVIRNFPGPGFVTQTGEDNSLFLLTGNVGLTLNDNAGSAIFMTAANTEVGLTLNTTDRNEVVWDLTKNSSPNVDLQAGGVSGVNLIFGFGQDPNASVDITAKDLASINQSRIGTIVTTTNGGNIDIIGGNFGVTFQIGSGPESILGLGNLNYHSPITAA